MVNTLPDKSIWDWEPGKRAIADVNAWAQRYEWLEEPYVSPDGEKIAAIVKPDEETFSVQVNGNAWENTYDKIWYLRFGPDGRLSAIVSDMASWTISVDDTPWENTYDFVWNPIVSADGRRIAAPVQVGREYLMLKNDIPWESAFFSINSHRMSSDGSKTAAVVQTVRLQEGDIEKFKKGCFSVAVDGKVWDRNFINAWDPSFSRDGTKVAASVRITPGDYTIAVDQTPWETRFSSVWSPVFNPVSGEVTAPVRTKNGWTMASDGKIAWDRYFVQLWNHIFSEDGSKIAAVAATKLGRWTMAVNSRPWKISFSDNITDPVFSADGKRLGCVGKNGDKFFIVVDDTVWDASFDMAWKPVFSPCGENLAAKVEQNGSYFIYLNGKPVTHEYEMICDPVFSPDGSKLLVRGVDGADAKGKYIREVISI